MCQNDNKFMGEFSINNNISDVTIEKKKMAAGTESAI